MEHLVTNRQLSKKLKEVGYPQDTICNWSSGWGIYEGWHVTSYWGGGAKEKYAAPTYEELLRRMSDDLTPEEMFEYTQVIDYLDPMNPSFADHAGEYYVQCKTKGQAT